jgi:hypothetical protein
MGEKMGLKAIIKHYEEMLEMGTIKHGGPGHARLLELKQKLKDKYLNSYYGRSITTKH